MTDEIQVPPPGTIQQLYHLAETVAEADAVTATFPPSILFAAYTGVRLGELLALTWRDLDGDEALVSKQLRRDGAIVPPKYGSERKILLPSPALFAIDSARTRGCVVPRPDNRIWDYSRREHTRVWGETRDRAGLVLRFHDLRHFAATRLLDMGASDLDVALQLGHKDGGELVRRRYGHPSPRKARERLRALEEEVPAA
jgi:integrase